MRQVADFDASWAARLPHGDGHRLEHRTTRASANAGPAGLVAAPDPTRDRCAPGHGTFISCLARPPIQEPCVRLIRRRWQSVHFGSLRRGGACANLRRHPLGSVSIPWHPHTRACREAPIGTQDIAIQQLRYTQQSIAEDGPARGHVSNGRVASRAATAPLRRGPRGEQCSPGRQHERTAASCSAADERERGRRAAHCRRWRLARESRASSPRYGRT